MHDPMLRTYFAKSCQRPTKSCRFWQGIFDCGIRFPLVQIATAGGRLTLYQEVDWHIEPDTDERMEAVGRKNSIREKG